MNKLRRRSKVAGISATQANTHASTTSLAASIRLIPSKATSPSLASAAANTEDSVHLSDSAKQYLQSSSQQHQTGDPGTTVEQLVRAAAAGDSGALSLLEVV